MARGSLAAAAFHRRTCTGGVQCTLTRMPSLRTWKAWILPVAMVLIAAASESAMPGDSRMSRHLLSDCETSGVLVPGGGPIRGSAGRGEWAHFTLEVPDTKFAGSQQVRVELLQPGRASFGAHLYVHAGDVDCTRTEGFDFEASKPLNCLSGACEELEWIIVPDAPRMLHVAVLGAGGDFYVLAESAAFNLAEVALVPDGSGGESAHLEGSPPVGFADWYRIPNNLEIAGGSLGQHTFGIQSAAAGQASRVQAYRILAPDEPVAKWVQGRSPDAVSWSMADWGWGESLAFSDPQAAEPTAGFLTGVEVFPSGIDVTRRDLFSPCTLSRAPPSNLAVVKPCDGRGADDGFQMTITAEQLRVPTADAAPAADVALGASTSPAQVQGRIDREQWEFIRIGVPQEQSEAWDGAASRLVRVTLRLRDAAAGPNSVAARTAKGRMRATTGSSFPLEQLGTDQYQLAGSCKPTCTLVIPVLPAITEVKVGLEVQMDNTGFVLEVVIMDMECGWMPTCSQCAEAAAGGRDCAWEASPDGPGFCFSTKGREDAPATPPECPVDGTSACHVEGSITAEDSSSCSACPSGCGWCGQPVDGTSHSGACVPTGLAEGTEWVGGHGPLGIPGDYLMSAGSCSAWHVPESEGAPRTSQVCEAAAKSAVTGTCEIASGDCGLCGTLAPSCTFCSDPSNPSKGYCVPIDSDDEVCGIENPWLGFSAGPRTCPPRSTPALPTTEQAAEQVSLPAPVPLPSSLSPASLGLKHGIASNAVYLSHDLGQQAGVQNIRVHVRAPRGAALRASARLDALPVPSAHAAMGSQRWDSDGEEYVMTLGALISPASARHLYFSLEQQHQADSSLADLSAEVWIDPSPGRLVSDAKDPVQGDICCGGLALYEVSLPEAKGEEPLEGFIVIEMSAAGSGSKDVLLAAHANDVPGRQHYTTVGRQGNAKQSIAIYVGPLANETERPATTWYVAVLAGADDDAVGNNWAATSTSFSLRASHKLKVGAEFNVPAGKAELGRFEFPIWAWVLIAVAFGGLAGIVVLIFIWVNRILYKNLRAKMYAVGDDVNSVGSPRESAMLMSNSNNWTADVESASALATPPTKGKAMSSTDLGKSKGFLGKLVKNVNAQIDGHKKWYSPKRWRQMSDNAGDDDRAARSQGAMTPGTQSPAIGSKVEMVGMIDGLLQDQGAAPADAVSTQLWRNSVGGSSSVVADGEGEADTPTSASATPAGSIGGGMAGMNLLNERMAVLAQAEELEEKRKPRPDSTNPVRLMSRTPSGPFQEAPAFAEEDNSSLRTKFSPMGSIRKTLLAVAPKLAPVPEPTVEEEPAEMDPSPNGGRRRLAPPPLKVLLESDEPTGDDILMLTEEEADVARQQQPDVNVRASWIADDAQARDRQLVPAQAAEPADVLPFQNDGGQPESGGDPSILPNYADGRETHSIEQSFGQGALQSPY